MKKIYAALAFFALVSFVPAKENFCRRSGIRGHVYLVKGNQMPSPDRPASTGKAVKTTLYVYPLTNVSQVSREGVSSFYKTISTTPVKEIETDENGYFKTKLKPGFYSLFVKKGDLFYANIYDDKNNIYPIEVRKGNWADVDFRADYDAAY